MLKQAILIVIYFSLWAPAFTQITEGKISYKSESFIGETGWEESLKNWRDTAISQETIQLIDKTEKQILAFLDKHKKIENDSADIIYYFDADKTRVLRNQEKLNNDFRIYDNSKLAHYRYRIKNGETKIDTVNWNAETIHDWELKYEIKIDTNDRKKILNFECYKITVNEFRQRNEGGPTIFIHELYVTDEIAFPAHIPSNWYRPIIKQCPLEIKSWGLNSPGNYSILTAIYFQKEIDKTVFNIPEKFVQKIEIDTIPFNLTSHNNISVKALLNQVDTVDLMFHTAAYSVTLISEISDKLKSVNWNQLDTVSSWGGDSDSRFSENNSIQIGPLQWDSLSIWETQHSGPTTDGKFGLNLFENKIVEINFDDHFIAIHHTLPAITDGYEKLNLLIEDDFMFLEGTSVINGEEFQNKFLIHSGYGSTILYDDEFVAKNKSITELKIIKESELKDSYGNVLKTKKAILPLFQIGSTDLTNLPVGFFEGAIGRQKMSVLGGDLLKRFNIVIDLSSSQIYFKTNSLANLPYTEF